MFHRNEERRKPLTVIRVEVRAEIKMFRIEQSEMNWASREERKGKKKINGALAAVKGTASRMGFTSGAQQLPNNLELKNYNNTDEVCEGF